MPRAISIHIGVNEPTWSRENPLYMSESNTWKMALLANQAGYRSIQVLRGPEATRGAVHDALSDAVRLLQAGDTLFLSFSGHGCRVGETGEFDDGGTDEALCLHDGILLDDTLAGYWRLFQRGVRILAVMESCYAGGMMRNWDSQHPPPMSYGDPMYGPGYGTYGGEGGFRDYGGYRGDSDYGDVMRTPFGNSGSTDGPRSPEPPQTPAAYSLDASVEDRLDAEADQAAVRRLAAPDRTRDGIQASVLLLAASKRKQKSRDGLFTHHLLRVWNDGRFDGSYYKLYQRVYRRVIHENPAQQPDLQMFGAEDATFPDAPAFRPQTDAGRAGAWRTPDTVYRGYHPGASGSRDAKPNGRDDPLR